MAPPVVSWVLGVTAVLAATSFIDWKSSGGGSDSVADELPVLRLRRSLSLLPGLEGTVKDKRTGGANKIVGASLSQHPKKRLPNFLLAGAQKGGTTATSSYLFKTGLVCGAAKNDTKKGYMKEPHFFDKSYRNGIDYYYSLYEDCGNTTILMDATPRNLLFPERIHEYYETEGLAETVKIMISVREPVARDISWYHHMYRQLMNGDRRGFVTEILKKEGSIMTFEEHMEIHILPNIGKDNPGWYAKWLKQWFNLFPRENILISSYDDFKNDPNDALKRLHTFLDLPIPNDGPLAAPHANSEHAATEEPIPCSVQQRLAAEYAEHNQELYVLLEAHPGPSMEHKPFPEFHFECQ